MLFFKNDKKKSRRTPQDLLEAAKDLERTRLEIITANNKTYLIIAAVAVLIATMTTSAYFVSTMYRTEPEPVVIEVDKSTGISSVRRSLKDDHDQYEDVINEYYATQYVLYRESYDWFSISSQAEAVKLMSNPQVYLDYNRYINSDVSPLEILNNKGRLKVEIVSITKFSRLFQVRYTTQQLSPSGEVLTTAPKLSWMATIGFKFDPKLKMTKLERLINPLGMQVVTYQTTQEATK